MHHSIQLVGISGSLRQNSLNTHLINAVKDCLPEGVSLEIISIADIPLYNADLDIPAVSERPEPVNRFRDALAKAEGIVMASPEYNYSIPGVLKNAIDWASRGADSPLLGKPVALMGASPGLMGTVRMQLAFLPVFQFLDMKPVHKPEVLVSQANQKFDENGKLLDEKALELIKRKIQALSQLIEETKTAKLVKKSTEQ